MIARIRNTTLRRTALVVSLPILFPLAFVLSLAAILPKVVTIFVAETKSAVRECWRKR